MYTNVEHHLQWIVLCRFNVESRLCRNKSIRPAGNATSECVPRASVVGVNTFEKQITVSYAKSQCLRRVCVACLNKNII